MKKALLFTLIIPLLTFAQLPENFTNGIPSTWAVFSGTNGEGTGQTWSTNSNGNAFCAPEAVASVSQDWLVTPAIAISSSGNLLSFLARDTYTVDKGSTYYIKVSTTSQTDISTFVNKFTWTENTMSHGSFGQFTIDMSAYEGQSIYIAFVLEQNDGDFFFLDNVLLDANIVAPNPAVNPIPPDTANNVSLVEDDNDGDGQPDNMGILVWEADPNSDDPYAYDVYFGLSDDNLVYLGETLDTTVGISGLSAYTTYYWKIVPFNLGGAATTTPTWSFTTGVLLDNETFEAEKATTTIYPNPSTNKVNIILSSKFDVTKTVVSIFDLSGKMVTSYNAINSLTIDNLQTGIYIVEITDGVNKETQKLVKK